MPTRRPSALEPIFYRAVCIRNAAAAGSFLGADEMVGLTLEGETGAPVVQATSPDGIAAKYAHRLRPGIRVLGINGEAPNGHAEATAIIKRSAGAPW